MQKFSNMVYVGSYGNYEIPDDVIIKAASLNHGKSLNDKRTKGFKYILWYGKSCDATQETIAAINKHIDKLE